DRLPATRCRRTRQWLAGWRLRLLPSSVFRDALVRQQPALDRQVEAGRIVMVGEAAQPAGGGDPVARDQQRIPVGAASLADRARRRADEPGDLPVRGDVAARNRRNDFPYLALERGADVRQRQIETVI